MWGTEAREQSATFFVSSHHAETVNEQMQRNIRSIVIDYSLLLGGGVGIPVLQPTGANFTELLTRKMLQILMLGKKMTGNQSCAMGIPWDLAGNMFLRRKNGLGLGKFLCSSRLAAVQVYPLASSLLMPPSLLPSLFLSKAAACRAPRSSPWSWVSC